MNNNDSARAAAALNAWEEWKEICWVAGCSAESQQILNAEIYNAFKRKFNRVCPHSTDEILTGLDPKRFYNEGTLSDADEDELNETEESHADPAPESDDEDSGEEKEDAFDEDDSEDDASDPDSSHVSQYSAWSSVFDLGIINARPPQSEAPGDGSAGADEEDISGLNKSYKEFVWKIKEKSRDNPLSVIRGKLIGPVSVINEIGDKYLQDNHPLIWENYKEKRNEKKRKSGRKSELNTEISLNQPIGGDDDGTLGDIIPDPGTMSPEHSHLNGPDDSSYDELDSFTTKELALILAHAAGGCVTSKVLQDFIGRGHDAIARMWNDPVNGLLEKCSKHMELFGKPEIFFRIISRIRSEKNSEALLSMLKTKFIEKGWEDVWE